jgi:hypothetical protein
MAPAQSLPGTAGLLLPVPAHLTLRVEFCPWCMLDNPGSSQWQEEKQNFQGRNKRTIIKTE